MYAIRSYYARLHRRPRREHRDLPFRSDLLAATVESSPVVACSGSTVLVLWEDTRNGNTDLAYRRSQDAGGTFAGLQFLSYNFV